MRQKTSFSQKKERDKQLKLIEQLLENCERLVFKTELPSEGNEGHATENERLLRNNQGHEGEPGLQLRL